jgi:hypothetical protein
MSTVFGVGKIQQRAAIDKADADRSNLRRERPILSAGRKDAPQSEREGDVGPGDRSRSRPAVRLQDVAVEQDAALAQTFQVGNRAQRSADQPLNFVRPPAEAASRCLALRSFRRRPREHGILRRDPTAAPAAQPRRQFVFDRSRAQDARVTQLDQRASLGECQRVWLDPHRTQRIVLAGIGPRRAIQR